MLPRRGADVPLGVEQRTLDAVDVNEVRAPERGHRELKAVALVAGGQTNSGGELRASGARGEHQREGEEREWACHCVPSIRAQGDSGHGVGQGLDLRRGRHDEWPP